MINYCEAQALLNVYRQIEKTCDAIEEYIDGYAFSFGPDPAVCGTEDITERIIELCERKKNLINLKIFIDNCVKKLPNDLRKIAVLKMSYRCNANKIREILGMSERTYFRKIGNMYDRLASIVNAQNTFFKVEEVMQNEKWIRVIVDRYRTKQQVLG